MARYWKDMIEQVVAGAAPAEVVAEGGMGGSSTIIDKPRLRLVSKHAGEGGHTAKVYKDLDYNEYRVKSYDPNGKHTGEAGDSFHDDLDDAQGTAKLYLKLIHARSQKSSKPKLAESRVGIRVLHPEHPISRKAASNLNLARISHPAIIHGGEVKNIKNFRKSDGQFIGNEPVVINKERGEAYSVHPNAYGQGIHGLRYDINLQSALNGKFDDRGTPPGGPDMEK